MRDVHSGIEIRSKKQLLLQKLSEMSIKGMKIAVFAPHRAQFGNITTQLPLFCALREEYPHATIVVFSKSSNSQILVDSGAADELILYKRFGLFKLISILRNGNFEQVYNSYSGSERVHFSIMFSGIKQKYGFSASKILDRLGFYTKHLYIKKGRQYIALNNLDLVNKVHAKDYSTNIIKNLIHFDDEEIKIDKQVTIIPSGGAGEFKRWSIESYCNSVRFITKNNKSIEKVNIIIGPGEESFIEISKNLLDGINFEIYYTPSISKLIEIAQRSDLTLSNDCGPCHIFQMMKVPMIMIWGWRVEPEKDLIRSPYFVLPEWYYANRNSWCVFPSEDDKSIKSISEERVTSIALMQLEAR